MQSKHLRSREYYNAQKVVEKKLVKTLKQSWAKEFQDLNTDDYHLTAFLHKNPHFLIFVNLLSRISFLDFLR